ncbi:MAG TPA: Tm-1-like ATP-binding domain-containing protein [Noviherbaspirillum sp.]|nr:Tm-1-like ATP-binding domain-containing protein [Noviherbaspirillum sp.]
MSARPPVAWVVGTFDTKAEELNYLAALLREAGVRALTVDVSTGAARLPEQAGRPDVGAREIARFHPDGEDAVFGSGDRGQAVIAMSAALCALVSARLRDGEIGGMLGIGGSGGTSMIAPAMRLLPLGMPKLLVSTMAAGNMAPFVDVVDMTTMFPVTDIAGLNRLSRRILANAAHALAGMLLHPPPASGDERPAIAISMFGVTTPCVQAIRGLLGDAYDTQVFHANGAGGRTLERLAAGGHFSVVVDITTTEVGQHLAGAVCDAGPDRLHAAAVHGLPWIGSLGALDMLNWGPIETVPERYRGRTFHVHNANVTLMRTNAEELAAAGRVIAARLNEAAGPVWLYVPEGGLSALDTPGKPFHDPAANRVLFDTLSACFEQTATHHLVRLPHHINDPEFAGIVAARTEQLMRERAPAGSAERA